LNVKQKAASDSPNRSSGNSAAPAALTQASSYSAIDCDPGLTGHRTLFVDFARDPAITDRLRQAMGAALVRTVVVGATRSDVGLFRTDGKTQGTTEAFFRPGADPAST
jgi:hypothetical protein